MPFAWNGSDIIYSRVIRPFFMEHKVQIDSVMGKVTDKLEDLAGNASNYAGNLATNMKKD